MHDPVQVEDQVIDTQGDFSFPSEPFGTHFINKSKNLRLNGIKDHHIGVKDIILCHLHMLHEIGIIRRDLHQAVTVFLCDPEHKPSVRILLVPDNRMVLRPGRYQHNVPGPHGIFFLFYYHGHIALQEKIELIIAVRMVFYLR